MSYIPPHKRHSKDDERLPTPELYIPDIRKKLNRKHSVNNKDRFGKFIYSNSAVSTWFVVGLNENDEFPSYVELKSVYMNHLQRNNGEKSRILVNNDLEAGKSGESNLKRPWDVIAEKVHQDLLSCFDVIRNEMENESLEEVKPTLAVRFGKIGFHGRPSKLENIEKDEITETLLRKLKHSIYTNIPASYMEHIVNKVVPIIGLDLEKENDIYHVMFSDNTKPDSTGSCKCRVGPDKKLEIFKVQLNQKRHMVSDISCLDKNLDLRIMLNSKRMLTALTGEEMESFRNLINLAIVDPEVKGGLRWPLGKNSSVDNRYKVIGIWHTVAKAYVNDSIRLKVRDADRFDFKTGYGEVTREVHLKLNGITSELLERGNSEDVVMDKLKDSLRLIWNNFMFCEPFLT